MLAVLGAGNMGAAVVRGVISSGALPARRLIVVDVDRSRLAVLEALGCACTSDAATAVRAAEQVLIAVKPQSFPSLATVIKPVIAARAEGAVIVSIMAGRSSTSIRAMLAPTARIVRAMPNTPCQIGEGITALALGDGAREGDETLAEGVFRAVGAVVRVKESLMHAVTALSGSGPAYVFLLAEAMLNAAERMGMPADTARQLATRTIIGAGRLLEQSMDQSPEALRRAVTSPGGTTAAAIEVMLGRDVAGGIADGIVAARDRGIALDAS